MRDSSTGFRVKKHNFYFMTTCFTKNPFISGLSQVPGIYSNDVHWRNMHMSVCTSSHIIAIYAWCAEIDREVANLKRDEAKLIQDIKKAAKEGNTASTRVLAKSLVRIKAQVCACVGACACTCA